MYWAMDSPGSTVMMIGASMKTAKTISTPRTSLERAAEQRIELLEHGQARDVVGRVNDDGEDQPEQQEKDDEADDAQQHVDDRDVEIVAERGRVLRSERLVGEVALQRRFEGRRQVRVVYDGVDLFA